MANNSVSYEANKERGITGVPNASGGYTYNLNSQPKDTPITIITPISSSGSRGTSIIYDTSNPNKPTPIMSGTLTETSTIVQQPSTISQPIQQPINAQGLLDKNPPLSSIQSPFRKDMVPYYLKIDATPPYKAGVRPEVYIKSPTNTFIKIGYDISFQQTPLVSESIIIPTNSTDIFHKGFQNMELYKSTLLSEQNVVVNPYANSNYYPNPLAGLGIPRTPSEALGTYGRTFKLLSIGYVQGITAPFLYPRETWEDLKFQVAHPIQAGKQFMSELIYNPAGAIGSAKGTSELFYGVAKVSKVGVGVLKPQYETYIIGDKDAFIRGTEQFVKYGDLSVEKQFLPKEVGKPFELQKTDLGIYNLEGRQIKDVGAKDYFITQPTYNEFTIQGKQSYLLDFTKRDAPKFDINYGKPFELQSTESGLYNLEGRKIKDIGAKDYFITQPKFNEFIVTGYQARINTFIPRKSIPFGGSTGKPFELLSFTPGQKTVFGKGAFEGFRVPDVEQIKDVGKSTQQGIVPINIVEITDKGLKLSSTIKLKPKPLVDNELSSGGGSIEAPKDFSGDFSGGSDMFNIEKPSSNGLVLIEEVVPKNVKKVPELKPLDTNRVDTVRFPINTKSVDSNTVRVKIPTSNPNFGTVNVKILTGGTDVRTVRMKIPNYVEESTNIQPQSNIQSKSPSIKIGSVSLQGLSQNNILSTNQVSKLSLGSIISTNQILSQVQFQKQVQLQKQLQLQQNIQLQKQVVIQRGSSSNTKTSTRETFKMPKIEQRITFKMPSYTTSKTTPTRIRNPFELTTPEPPTTAIPKFDFNSGMGSKNVKSFKPSKKSRLKVGYFPSIEASLFNIRTSKGVNLKQAYSGLTLRPIRGG